jgi:hypothetical protein
MHGHHLQRNTCTTCRFMMWRSRRVCGSNCCFQGSTSPDLCSQQLRLPTACQSCLAMVSNCHLVMLAAALFLSNPS